MDRRLRMRPAVLSFYTPQVTNPASLMAQSGFQAISQAWSLTKPVRLF
jgi:hypothetical protein